MSLLGCMRCRTLPHRYSDSHHVWYNEPGSLNEKYGALPCMGIFPLCEKCWQETDVDERVAYTMNLIREYWGESARNEQLVAAILKAVRADKG